jgi:3-oxoacyl-(acyl-carrier-protein) synthase
VLDVAEARRMSRVSQLTVAAARLAVTDAGLPADAPVGVVVGTEFGDLRSTIEFADGFLGRGPTGLSALLFPNTVMNTMAGATSIAVRAREASLTLNAPLVGGELAVARATFAVSSGRLPCALAGGVDQLEPEVVRQLDRLGSGSHLGEGATFLVLEPRADAERRGATILGVIAAAAWGALPARPYGVGRCAVSRVIARALDMAGLGAADVGWIYRSASGDAPLDRWESAVIERALGRMPPQTTLGGARGHHAGLGALRVAAAAWTARSGLLPLDRDDVARVSRGPGLVHGLGRGGTHVALVVSAAEAVVATAEAVVATAEATT